MIVLGEIDGPLAAFIAGAITSLHCVGMCGPLSCGVCLKDGGRKSLPALAVYHAGRVLAYAGLGAVAGAVGKLATGNFLDPLSVFFPGVFVLFFLLVALGWDKRAGHALYGVRVFRPAFARANRLGAIPGAGLLGLVTPFIPCGPLYLMLGAAVISGSGWQGALLLAAFAGGVVPFYFGVQAGFFRLGVRLSPSGLDHTRRALAVVSVALLLGRMLYNGGIEGTSCLIGK